MKLSIKKFIFSFIFILFITLISGALTHRVYAVDATPTPTPDQTTDNTWTPDPDVTFAGDAVIRAQNFLDWNLEHYQWSAFGQDASLSDYWVTVRNIVYALLLLVIFSAAVVMIISRGGNMTVWQYVRKFLIIIVLITFSFALIRILYQLIDIIQGFFGAGGITASGNLFDINFKYGNLAHSLSGSSPVHDESVFVSTNLLKITAITYYVMGATLLVRKVILWFFIIVSPVFPLLILYMPLRNTAKIWVGEFFRWLLYAPLFMLFLKGVVMLWGSQIAMLGMTFPPDNATPQYPPAIDIPFGFRGQLIDSTHIINNNLVFIQYVTGIIMLWAVVLIPFLLLRIFLDYVATLSIEEDGISYLKKGINRLSLGNNVFGGESTKKVETKSQARGSVDLPSLPFQHREVPGIQEVESPTVNFTKQELHEPSIPDISINSQVAEPLRHMNTPEINKTNEETPIPVISSTIPHIMSSEKTSPEEQPRENAAPMRSSINPVQIHVPSTEHTTQSHTNTHSLEHREHEEEKVNVSSTPVKINEHASQ